MTDQRILDATESYRWLCKHIAYTKDKSFTDNPRVYVFDQYADEDGEYYLANVDDMISVQIVFDYADGKWTVNDQAIEIVDDSTDDWNGINYWYLPTLGLVEHQ